MSESGVRKADVRAALAAAALLTAAMVPLLLQLKFDYDEWLEFHAIWQVGAGHKPYADFNFPRPPYHWMLWSPILRLLPERIESLVALKALNLGASFAALALWFLALLGLKADASWRGCALGAAAFVVLRFPVLFTLAQFRPDHLVLALTIAGLILLEGGPPRWAAAGFFFGAAFLLTPKLALVYAVALPLYAYDRWKTSGKEARRCAAAAIGGLAASFAILNGLALLAGIDVRPYFGILHRHLLATAQDGYPFGLARMLLLRAAYDPVWLAVCLGGLWASAAELRERGWRRNKLLLVWLAFALIQPLWIKYFYDQYLYTVMLAWSLPLALFFHRVGKWPSPAAQGAVALIFVAGAWYAVPELVELKRSREGLRSDVEIGDALLELAPKGRPVAMQPPRHPVFRENSTYFIEHSVTPRGPVTEQLMAHSAEYARLFTYEGYLEQLERRPPSLIWTNQHFTGPEYRRAIADFERLRARDYEARDVLGVSVLVRKTTRP